MESYFYNSELKARLGFILATIFAIIAVFAIAGLKYYNDLEDMVVEDFNQQQLILAQATAQSIEGLIKKE